MSLPSLALADASDDDVARAHFQLGTAHYESGTFLKAAAEFEEAYRISKRPQLLFNIYLAYRDANEPRKAADALRGFLEQVEEVPNRRQLEAKLRALEKDLADAEQAQANSAGVPPEGSQDPELDAAATEADDAATAAPPAVTAAPPATTEGGGNSKLLPIVLMASGGALIAGAVVTGLMAASDKSTLDEQCPNRTMCSPELESTLNRGKTLAVVTDVLWISGLAAAGTGAVLFLLSGGKERSTAGSHPPRASLACASDGCRGSLQVTF